MKLLHASAPCTLERNCNAAMQEAGDVFVIGNGGCGQLGMGEDDVEAVRARLSSIATGVKVRVPLSRCYCRHSGMQKYVSSPQCTPTS